MVKHKFKSIKDKGGLKAHVLEMGYSYRIFKLLVSAKTPDTTTANILTVEKRMRKNSKDHDPLSRATIKHWKTVHKEEQEEIRRTQESEIENLKQI